MTGRDDRDFAAFARATGPSLRRTAYLMCGDWDRAADIAQEALIRVYMAWPRLDPERGVHAYARKAAASSAIDQGRKRSSRPRTRPTGSPTARSCSRPSLTCPPGSGRAWCCATTRT